MSTLYLLNYNNYYNRIVKSTTLANYKSAALYTLKDVNFKPMDSCYTDQIVNISESINPDYVVITETANNVESIASRWFILESSRTRGNQYKLRLRRDVFVDYNSIVSGATLFCEKGYVNPDDPLIFNSEGNTYNQIKVSEKLLKDTTGSAWLVGYCDRNLMQEAVGNEIDITMSSLNLPYTMKFNNEAAMIAAFQTSQYTGDPTYHYGRVEDVAYYFGVGQQINGVNKYYNLYASPSNVNATERAGSANNMLRSVSALVTWIGMNIKSADGMASDLIDDLGNIQGGNYTQKIVENEGAIAQVGTAEPYKYYRLDVTWGNRFTHVANITSSYTKTKAALNSLLTSAYNAGIWAGNYAFPNDAQVSYTGQTYCAYWTDITESVTAAIADTVPMSTTAPYYMFVLPYHDCKYDTGDGVTRTSKSVYSMKFVQSLIQTVGTHVLDVQLLPYFPDQYIIHSGVIDFTNVSANAITYIEDSSNNKYGFIYWGAPQTFNFRINETINTLSNLKIDNETRFCRLTAPNYSASMDFSIAKNRGVSNFRCTCTYRPYQPHIQVMPEWGGIYGQYFPDGRGLICGGDYSVDIVNDQWTEYQIMNKNYQLIFDRQIQSMDIQHDVQKINDIFGAASGTLSGAASGAMMGSFLGPVGMGVGALIGGLVSGVGGVLDVTNQQKLRTDQREVAFDMFNYNLGNIQARPTTITKMSALVGNNKIWPFYEIYSATSREQQVLEEQLNYSSMTVKAIGIVSQFVSGGPTFVRGRLIRITGLEHDAEMSQLVADELARGIYMDIQLS